MFGSRRPVKLPAVGLGREHEHGNHFSFFGSWESYARACRLSAPGQHGIRKKIAGVGLYTRTYSLSTKTLLYLVGFFFFNRDCV